jgi:hypothetical protein
MEGPFGPGGRAGGAVDWSRRDVSVGQGQVTGEPGQELRARADHPAQPLGAAQARVPRFWAWVASAKAVARFLGGGSGPQLAEAHAAGQAAGVWL